MRQFGVYDYAGAGRVSIPFFVMLQSHHFASTGLVIAAPLISSRDAGVYPHVSVPVSFAGAPFVVQLQEMAATPQQLLGNPVGDLGAYEDAIRRGLDRLFTGF